jgi:hypothetical protein
MEKALRVINRMHKEGVLKEYAIGGAIATIYYTEPFATNDVDILIDETPIQFLPAATELEKEAVQHAIAVTYKNIQVNVLRPEYLIAIFLRVFRLKDREKIVRLLEQAEIDQNLLSDILTRHGLKEKFENFTGER